MRRLIVSRKARPRGQRLIHWREAEAFAGRVEGLAIEDLPLFRRAA